MSETKAMDYTGVGTSGRSKPLPRLPLRKSSARLTMTTNKSSAYASTPSKFYISEQESLREEEPTKTRGAQGGLFNFGRRVFKDHNRDMDRHFSRNKGTNDNRPTRPGPGLVDNQQRKERERPSRSIRVNVNNKSGGGGGGGGGGGAGGERGEVELYSPISEARTPQLISKNIITYHSNFFEGPTGEGEEGRLRRSDPLEVEELELQSPMSDVVAMFAVGGGSAGLTTGATGIAEGAGIATSTPLVRGALSPVDFGSESSDFYQHQQYQQQQQHHHHAALPSHRNRSLRGYEGVPTSPGGRAAAGAGNEFRARRKPKELPYYDIEGSWAYDASGRAYFRGTGKIEEIHEVEGIAEENEPEVESPAQSLKKSSLESAGLDSQNRLKAFRTPEPEFEITSPLPPATTPPPRPKRVEEVVLSPGGTNFSIPKTAFNNSGVGLSEVGVGRGNGNGFNPGQRHQRVGLGVRLDLPMDLDAPFGGLDTPPAPPPAALPAPTHTPALEAHQESEELDLEMQSLMKMLKHVDTGIGDVKALRDFFIKMCAVYFLRKHIDVTYRVEAALLEVQEAIDRRCKIPQTHLDIRTAEWQEKFELRLVSFRTTIKRLTALREFAEKRKKLTEQHLEDLFQRLLAHEAKYTDIAAKLHASYDRLKLRHLHTQLESAYKAEVEARKERKARKRKSFRRKREAKTELARP